MRADLPIFKNPRARKCRWFVVGVVGLVCVFGVVWRIEKRAGPMPEASLSVLEVHRFSGEEPATRNEAAAPSFDDRDAPRVERAGVDASTFYKDAFALYDGLSAEEKQMLSRPSEEVEADRAAALFEKIQPIMELLRRGGAAGYCDWGLGEFDVDKPFPQLGRSQNLGKVALWNAAYRFPSDAEGAIDDLAARARLGHDLGDSLIGWIIETSFERSATDLLRQNAPSLSDEGLARARAFLSSSTLDADISRAMATEMQISRSFFERLLAQKPEDRLTVTQTLNRSANKPDNSEEARQGESLMRDPALLEAEFQVVQKIQSQVPEAMLWGDAQFNEWAEQFGNNHTAAHPLLFDEILEIRAKFQSRRIEREMLSVALAVLESGPEQASRSRDPVTGRAFVYLATPGGFELQSAFQSKGKPLTMSFDLPK